MKSKRIIRKTSLASKSEEQIKDERLKKPAIKAYNQLRRSAILKILFPKSPLPKDAFFSKPQLYFYIARMFVSLAKHQKERRQISDHLHVYMDKLKNEETRLVKKTPGINKTKIESIGIRLRICKELLRYSQYEHADNWKDLAYYKLFKYLKLMWKLKYNDIIEIMSKLSVFYGQEGVSCKEEYSLSGKSFTRYFPAYSSSGKLQIIKDHMKPIGDNKLKKQCDCLNGETKECEFNYCERERANIAKRLMRIMAQKDKGLLFYNEQKYGEITWQGFLEERKTFTGLYKKKRLHKVPINDTEKYISEEIKHTYLKHHIDGYMLRKILIYLKLNPQEYINDLLSDKEFCQAVSLQV